MQVTRNTRVLIADDHVFVLEGLVNLLKDRFEVVAAVTDGYRLVDAATRLRPDVIVTDISMPVLGPYGDALAVLTCPYLRRIDRHVGPDLRQTCDLLQRAVHELSIA